MIGNLLFEIQDWSAGLWLEKSITSLRRSVTGGRTSNSFVLMTSRLSWLAKPTQPSLSCLLWAIHKLFWQCLRFHFLFAPFRICCRRGRSVIKRYFAISAVAHSVFLAFLVQINQCCLFLWCRCKWLKFTWNWAHEGHSNLCHPLFSVLLSSSF